eukprot:scaffold12850_cov109-Isochrysis_galbana.AAC.5
MVRAGGSNTGLYGQGLWPKGYGWHACGHGLFAGETLDAACGTHRSCSRYLFTCRVMTTTGAILSGFSGHWSFPSRSGLMQWAGGV